ncbi:MAG: hypothetical protein H0T46_24820 [Deltaproteobacteria bacterium]|nr:hypothetical protein [Deltaproteobacteria bacterium]
MAKLVLWLPLVVLVACGDNLEGNEPPGTPIPSVDPGCRDVAGDLESFKSPGDFGPFVESSLEGWDPDGRWFLTGTRTGGVSSFHFERRGEQLIFDRDEENPGIGDDSALFQRGLYEDSKGEPFLIAKRVVNLKLDGTARADRAVCGLEGCTVCTAKLIRATHHADEGESEKLSLAGELFGDTWDPGTTFNVRVAGTIAYLIRLDGLHIIETADPANPTELYHWRRNGPGYSNDVKIVEANGKRYAIIADYPSDVVEVTDPATAHLVAQIPVEAHTVFTETRNGKTYAYFGAYDGSTPAYDVTNPEAPVRLSMYDAKASVVHDLMIDNGIAYLNAWEEGLHVVDFTNPSQPVLLGTWKDTPTKTSHSSWAMTVGGRKIALHGEEAYGAHLDVVDVDRTSPTFMRSIGSFRTRDWVSIHNVMSVGTRAYMTYYQDGIRVLDMADPTRPKQLGYFNTWDPQGAKSSSRFFEGAVGIDVDPVRKLIFVADSPRGLVILRDETF